jgi:hypothetical protein
MLRRFIIVLIVGTGMLNIAHGQTLKEQINNMFGEVLNLELSPGEHGEHFLPVNVATSQAIINSLNSFIGASISSFPLSSSTAGVTFDFSTGRPVPTSTSFGPIFSERGQTVGRGRIKSAEYPPRIYALHLPMKMSVCRGWVTVLTNLIRWIFI